MTDVEINKALALAIGWKEFDMILDHEANRLCFTGPRLVGTFDYKDWRVIGPIAERYDVFPYKVHGQWAIMNYRSYFAEDTPQRAIALAVIEEKND